MTHILSETELAKLSDTELRLKLSETFNTLAALRKSSQEYALAKASVETLKRALAKRLHGPQP